MEAHFYLSPLIEPIGRKPYLKKWIDHKSAYNGFEKSHPQHQFDDIYRYLFQILERENLELAYQFRYTVEAAGSDPFIKRQGQLDRALKRAKNKAFKPLERLLQQIQLDLGLDYDQVSSTLTVRKSIVREAVKLDAEYENAILPFIPNPTTPDNSDHHIPFGQYNWQQNPEDIAELPEEDIVTVDSEMQPHERINQGDVVKTVDCLPADLNENQTASRLLNKNSENPNGLPEITTDSLLSESQLPPDIQMESPADPLEEPEAISKTEPSVHKPHTSIMNRGVLDQATLEVKSSKQVVSATEDTIIPGKKDGTSNSGLNDNHKGLTFEPIFEGSVQEFISESKKPNKELKGYSQYTPNIDEEIDDQKIETKFKPVTEVDGSGYSNISEEKNLHEEQGKAAVNSPTLPFNESPLQFDKANDEKQSIPDNLTQSSSLKSKKTVKSSNNETVKSVNINIEQDITDYNESNGDNNEQAEHFFEQSDTFKSHNALNREASSKDSHKEIEEKPTDPSLHKSLGGSSTQNAPKAMDRSFMRSLKSPVRHIKTKFGTKDNHVASLDTHVQDEEHHPNLPKSTKKIISLPFKIRKRNIPVVEEETLDTIEKDANETKNVNYNLADFKLPSGISETDQDNNIDDNGSASESGETADTFRDYADPRIGLIQSRKELITRINKQKENGENGEFQDTKPAGKNGSAPLPPPPLYNFKFELKKPIINRSPEAYDHGTSLVIFKDCIERRSTTAADKKHFLAGSSTWNYFQRKDYQPFFRDTTSLVIQRDCIEHRILNNPLPTKHTLEMSSSELETFKAFDAYYNDSGDGEEEEFFVDDYDSSFDGSDGYSFYDPYEDKDYNRAVHEKQRKELYQTCLSRLNQKDGLLFDYRAGKIAIDNTDKHEIDKWVRSQQSESIEIYRAYAEAIMQPTMEGVKEIQDLVRSKLQKADFPSKRVRDIFDKLKEKSQSIELKQNDLVGILKRQDFVSVETNSLSSTISFSNSYSRYRAWRNTVESPKIEVRPVNSSESQPIIPFESFRRKWSYLDTPKISVRSSSDYQFKRTLPVFDKVYSWRKTHS